MKFYSVLIIGLLLTSCESNSNFLEDASWLEGKWERPFNNSVQIENWHKSGDFFIGQNQFVSQGDTVIMNTIYIRKKGTSWELSKHVTNSDIEFYYSLQHANKDSIVFQNTENVWPQNIIYKKNGMNEMELIIDGQDGTMHKNVAFTFQRSN